MQVLDRRVSLSTTTGTGDFTLTVDSVPGFKAWNLSIGCFPYLIEAVDEAGTPTGEWETGVGFADGTGALTRDFTGFGDNSSGVVNPLDFSAGTKRVWIALNQAALQELTFSGDGSATLASANTAYRQVPISAGSCVSWDFAEIISSNHVHVIDTPYDVVKSFTVEGYIDISGTTDGETVWVALGRGGASPTAWFPGTSATIHDTTGQVIHFRVPESFLDIATNDFSVMVKTETTAAPDVDAYITIRAAACFG